MNGGAHSKWTCRFRILSVSRLSSRHLSARARICQGEPISLHVSDRCSGFLLGYRSPLIDKVTSGFLAWQPTLKGYAPPAKESLLDSVWEKGSRPALQTVVTVLRDTRYFTSCLSLWAQESDIRGAMSTDLALRYATTMPFFTR